MQPRISIGQSLDIGRYWEAVSKGEQKSAGAPRSGSQEEFTSPVPWWALLVVAMAVGGWVLSSSADFSILEDAFTKQVHGFIVEKAVSQARAQFPHLSPQEIGAMAQKRVDEAVKDSKTAETIRALVDTNRGFFQNEQGHPYLLENDAYYYLRYAENILRNGHPGEELRNGVPIDPLRKAPHGIGAGWSLLPYVEAWWFRLWDFFSSDVTLMKSAFYLPVALGMVSVALMFALALTIFGRTELAFFSAILFAVHPYFFRQNMAGFADTTILILPLSLAFFLSVVWLAKGRLWQRLLASAGVVASAVCFSYTWAGWYFVLGVVAVFCGLYALLNALRKDAQRRDRIAAIVMGVFGLILSLIMLRQGYLYNVLKKLQLTGGIPGIQETVLELGRPTLDLLLFNTGGILFLVFFAVGSVLLSLKIFRHRASAEELFVLAWFITLLVPALLIVRFMFFVMPPAVLIVGWVVERFWRSATSFVKSLNVFPKRATAVLLMFIIPGAIGATMIDTTSMQLPPMSDAVTDISVWLQENSAKDAILNTWWDYGYVWQYAARRRTVLDAGPDIVAHWMAKAFVSDDVNYSRGVLRMLDCDSIVAPREYVKSLGVSGIRVLEGVLKLPREQAAVLLNGQGVGKLINHTHCDPPEAYIIADKHTLDAFLVVEALSLWDDELSEIKDKTAGLSEADAVEYVKRELNISREDAEQKYVDARAQSIEKRERAVSVIKTCDVLNSTAMRCWNFDVDKETLAASRNGKIPFSVLFFENGTRRVRTFPESESGLSLAIYKDEGEVYRTVILSKEYSDSLFTRLFFGEVVEGFTLVSQASQPERILAWKIDWQPKSIDSMNQSRVGKGQGRVLS